MLAATTREAARRHGDMPAFVAPAGWSLSFAALDRLSGEVAAFLVSKGVGPGDTVALALPSSPDYAVAYVACAKAGAAAAGINPRYTAPERAAALDVVQPRLVLTTPALATATKADTVEVSAAQSPDDILSAARTTGEAPTIPSDEDRPVAIVLTSGTTGTPKGAVFCERQLAAIAAMDWGERWGGGGPALASTEFAHVGFMTKLPWYLRAGMRMHILERWRAADALRAIAGQHISSVGAIGSQIALMLRDPSFGDYDFSHVRTIVAGGGPSPAAIVREARERFGAAYSIRYSSTESGGVGTATAFDAPDEEALETVGRPREGVEVRIDAGSGGEAGEVLLRSDAVMSGYHRDATATAATLVDGWLRTGDLGRIDERGCLRLVGRVKEMFVRGGYNVYPAEVESVLAAHPGVEAVAVVPRPDEVMGETGVAIVVATGGMPPTLEELRAFAAERLAAYKLPESLRVVPSLPLTPMHKVDRAKLVREIRGEH